MAVVPQSLIPMAHVADVPRAVAFYQQLGFELRHTHTPDGCPAPTWASLQTNNAQLMLVLASHPVDRDQQAVLFYLYFADIHAVHLALKAAGLDVGTMTYPFYCPKGEFRLIDPDGYCLILTHT